MKLFWKLSLPQMILVPILGIISFFFISNSFVELQQRNQDYIVNDTFTSIEKNIEQVSRTAQDTASLFANLPEVIAAYELAHSGNIDAPDSQSSQAARAMLREELAPILKGYQQATGSKLKLHFHLPNGRSLVRLWRDKQTKKNGVWVDISDDISSFRRTVLDVNSSGQPVSGIELGRGGFVMRGLIPIKNAQGKTLGSVEVLKSFSSVLNIAKQKNIPALLFMEQKFLNITTKLNNKEKYPRLFNNVLVNRNETNKYFTELIDADFLAAASKERTVRKIGHYTFAGNPILDYRGQQVGTLVGVIDSSEYLTLANNANMSLLATLAAILLLPLIGMIIMLKKYVTQPLAAIGTIIKDLAENKADLTARLNVTQKDEVGALSQWFNSLMDRITAMIDEMEVFKIVLNTVPDPIFAVDENMNILIANKAVEDFAAKDSEGLLCMKCFDVFNTPVCNSSNCPIEKAKKAKSSVTTDVISLDTPDGTLHIQPVADILYDTQGNCIGYVEVARNVTGLIDSERKINSQLSRIENVFTSTKRAASELLNSSSELEAQVTGVTESVSAQQQRISETSSAMEQMNVSVSDVARGAAHASSQAEGTRERAAMGAEVVSNAIDSITSLHSHATAMTNAMTQLGTQADSIGTVLSVISDIADQTNLLALNAAIEAARAGDAGRGFAVVADEVRKLAEKTMQATKEVNDAIITIQGHAKSSISTTRETMTLIDTATSFANDSGQALQEIVGLANSTANEIGNIATAAEQQSTTSEQVAKAMEEIHLLVGAIAEEMHDSSSNVKALSQLAQQLDALSKE